MLAMRSWMLTQSKGDLIDLDYSHSSKRIRQFQFRVIWFGLVGAVRHET